MSLVTRLMMVAMLLASLAAAAQQPSSTASAPSSQPAQQAAEDTEPSEDSYIIRDQFIKILRENHPPSVWMVVKLDPSLLTNKEFLAGYPRLARYLDQTPEIRRNPSFYLNPLPHPASNNSVLDEIIETVVTSGAIIFCILAVAWLIRTIIEQRRWNKLTRQQSEVHNKILDRFGSSEELLQYIKTPSGAKFLESAPITLQPEKQSSSPGGAPLLRVIRSVQIGVIAAVAALGFLLMSFRFSGETSEGLFSIGAIVFCIGAGFIASAVVSMVMSRRLGLWQDPSSPIVTPFDDRGGVR